MFSVLLVALCALPASADNALNSEEVHGLLQVSARAHSDAEEVTDQSEADRVAANVQKAAADLVEYIDRVEFDEFDADFQLNASVMMEINRLTQVHTALEVQTGRSGKFFAPQRAWAATAISKMEKTVCARKKKSPITEDRKCHWGFWCTPPYAHPMGGKWGTNCCLPCKKGWTGIGAVQCRTCGDWNQYALYCYEPCTKEAGLPQMTQQCTSYRCAKDAKACAAYAANIGLNFLNVVATLMPAAKAASKAIAVAYKSGVKGAVKTAIKGLLRKGVQKMVTQVKTGLLPFMKKKGMALGANISNIILEGGAQALLAEATALKTPALKKHMQKFALDMLEMVDPTGIVSLVRSFSSPNCDSMRIQAMPKIPDVPVPNQPLEDVEETQEGDGGSDDASEEEEDGQ